MQGDRIDVKAIRDRQAAQAKAKADLIADKGKGDPTTIKTLLERVKKLEAAAGI